MMSMPLNSCVSGFGPGAKVLTLKGEMPIEWLSPGDKVITRDNGAQPVVWVTRSLGVGPDHLPLAQPVHMQPGATGISASPDEALRLSPDSHVLVNGPLVEMYFGTNEAMARIGDLTRSAEMRAALPKGRLRYHHLVTPQHDLILVSGVWVETTGAQTARFLRPSPEVLDATTVFSGAAMSPRLCLTRTETRLLTSVLPREQSILDVLAA